MKNLITSIACVMILMAFVMQFAHNQVLHSRISLVDQTVEAFKDTAKQEGCITEENERWLKETLSQALQCRRSEILVSGDRNRLARGELIHYEVKVPVGDIVAMPLFWGISREENRPGYILSRYTASEYAGAET